MIIPIYKNPDFKVGDIVISLNGVDYNYCRFSMYHEFSIIHIKNSNENSHILKDTELGIEIKVNSLRDFAIKTTLDKAIKRYEQTIEKNHIIKFLEKNCKNQGTEYDDREQYTICKINKNKNYCDNCVPTEDCLQYIDNDLIIKDKIVNNYIRNKKIKILNDKKPE